MSTPQPLPFECYFDSKVDKYLVKDGKGIWMPLNRSEIKNRLIKAGIDGDKPKHGIQLSPCDLVITRIQDEKHVLFSDPLAGYKAGLHTVNNTPILVTQSPVLVEAREGTWPLLKGILEGLFGPNDHHRQLERWHAYVKVSDEGLQDCVATGNSTYGQTVIFAGPKNCGKSLLQQLFTEMLGGRVAHPFAFMAGTTAFNKEIFAAEHLMIEDEQPFSQSKDRIRFGDAIKKISASKGRACYGKGRDAITLTPFWRLTISANEDSIEVLPVFGDSLKDKVLVFRCFSTPMPMPAGTAAEKSAFFKALCAEIPAYIYWLRHSFTIPAELTDNRYGLKAFIHDDIQHTLDQLSPDRQVLSLIDHILFQSQNDLDRPWEGTCEQLIKLCWESVNYKEPAKALIKSTIGLGRALGRLHKALPSRVSPKKTDLCNKWVIHAPPIFFEPDPTPVSTIS